MRYNVVEFAAPYPGPSLGLRAFSLVLALAVMIAHRFGGLATTYLVLLLIDAAGGALLSALLAEVGLRSLWMTGAEGGL
ncbi:hypothetical protein ACDA55_37840, partial [Rhizobium ruizarguesonis]